MSRIAYATRWRPCSKAPAAARSVGIARHAAVDSETPVMLGERAPGPALARQECRREHVDAPPPARPPVRAVAEGHAAFRAARSGEDRPVECQGSVPATSAVRRPGPPARKNARSTTWVELARNHDDPLDLPTIQPGGLFHEDPPDPMLDQRDRAVRKILHRDGHDCVTGGGRPLREKCGEPARPCRLAGGFLEAGRGFGSAPDRLVG
jgi:hypothetical protein